jgi:hypothetical protein
MEHSAEIEIKHTHTLRRSTILTFITGLAIYKDKAYLFF